MSRLTKARVLEMLREASCIKSPILNRYFKSVWVGEEMKQIIDKSNKRFKK